MKINFVCLGKPVRYMSNHNIDPNVLKSGTFDVIWKKKLLVRYLLVETSTVPLPLPTPVGLAIVV